MNTSEDQSINARTTGNELFQEKQRRRSLRIAFVLASTAVMSLLFLVYALVQKEKATQAQHEAAMLQAQLIECQSSK